VGPFNCKKNNKVRKEPFLLGNVLGWWVRIKIRTVLKRKSVKILL